MKNFLIVFLLLGVPLAGSCQQKQAAKRDNTKSSAAAKPLKEATGSGSLSCSGLAAGVHLMLSGMEYDAEGVIDEYGNATFTNVPAGDKVMTRTGQDRAASTCRFTITCQGAAGKNSTKSGNFDQLAKGVSFRMGQAGNVVISVK